MHPPKTAKQVCTFLELIRYYRKFIRNFAKMAKPLMLLTCQKAKFEWTPIHHTACLRRKWSTTEQEAYRVYHTVTKWNYYFQGAEVIIQNDHKLLARFLNRKNANNKVNRWGLELATYNITFVCISRAWNKAADCLSRLAELPHDRQATVQMLSATNHDGPAFHTRSRTAESSMM